MQSSVKPPSFAEVVSPESGSATSARLAAAPVAVPGFNPAHESVPQAFARAGVQDLAAGHVERAVQELSAALKYDYRNPEYHYLLAVAFNASYALGNSEHRKLAEAGYLVALRIDPGFTPAKLGLARLLAERGEYRQSHGLFSEIADSGRANGDALYGAGLTALALGDLDGAGRNAERLGEIGWTSPLRHRLSALVMAARGDEGGATRELAAYRTGGADRQDAVYLGGRVEALAQTAMARGVFGSGAGAPRRGAGDPPAALAQQQPGQQQPGQMSGPRQPYTTYAWWECPGDDPRAPAGRQLAVSGTALSDSVVNQLPALPAPCQPSAPRMAVLEATVFTSEDIVTENRGVNLLDGLSAFVGASSETVRQLGDSVGRQTIDHMVFGLGNSAEGTRSQIQYSQKIATSVFGRNSVIASPNILLIDRVPSEFFTGSDLIIGLQGGLQGSSSITQRPIGFGISATATFIDDDHALVTIKMIRESLQAMPWGFNFAQNSFATTRNHVIANAVMRFDEPMVLHGFSGRGKEKTVNRTPLLGDLPVAQYLFKNSLRTDDQQQVISLITLRRPPRAENAQADGGPAAQLLARLSENKNTQSDNLVRQFSGMKEFDSFVRNDVMFPKWNKPYIDGIIRDFTTTAYISTKEN